MDLLSTESPGLWQEPVPNKASPGPACVFCITWGISGEAVSKKHPETMAGIQSLILRNRIFQELPKGLAPHLGAPTWLLSQQEAGTAWWRCHFTVDTSHTTAPPPGTALPRFKPRTKILILPMSSHLLYQPCPSMFPHPILGTLFSSQVPPPPKSEECAAQQGSQRPCSLLRAALCPLLALPRPLDLDTKQENKTYLLGRRPTWPLRTRLGWGTR